MFKKLRPAETAAAPILGRIKNHLRLKFRVKNREPHADYTDSNKKSVYSRVNCF